MGSGFKSSESDRHRQPPGILYGPPISIAGELGDEFRIIEADDPIINGKQGFTDFIRFIICGLRELHAERDGHHLRFCERQATAPTTGHPQDVGMIEATQLDSQASFGKSLLGLPASLGIVRCVCVFKGIIKIHEFATIVVEVGLEQHGPCLFGNNGYHDGGGGGGAAFVCGRCSDGVEPG